MKLISINHIPLAVSFDEGIPVPMPRGIYGTWQRAAGEDDHSPQTQRI